MQYYMEPPLTMQIRIWVYGSHIERLFSVNISRTETVESLKIAIKNENSVNFHDMDATDLDLYSISFDEKDKLNQWKPNVETMLSAQTKSSDIFSESDNMKWLFTVNSPTLGAPLQY